MITSASFWMSMMRRCGLRGGRSANVHGSTFGSLPVADGIVIAKEAFRLVEQLQGYQGEEVASYLFHAFGTNLQFEDDEFNFVRTRAERGATKAIELCKAHFEVPEP